MLLLIIILVLLFGGAAAITDIPDGGQAGGLGSLARYC
jgi:hypothetical protein